MTCHLRPTPTPAASTAPPRFTLGTTVRIKQASLKRFLVSPTPPRASAARTGRSGPLAGNSNDMDACTDCQAKTHGNWFDPSVLVRLGCVGGGWKRGSCVRVCRRLPSVMFSCRVRGFSWEFQRTFVYGSGDGPVAAADTDFVRRSRSRERSDLSGEWQCLFGPGLR